MLYLFDWIIFAEWITVQLESACMDKVSLSSSVQVSSGEEVQGSVPDNSCNKYYCVPGVLIYNRQV